MKTFVPIFQTIFRFVFSVFRGVGGLNYDLYEHCLYDLKINLGIYKKKTLGEKWFQEIELGHSGDIFNHFQTAFSAI